MDLQVPTITTKASTTDLATILLSPHMADPLTAVATPVAVTEETSQAKAPIDDSPGQDRIRIRMDLHNAAEEGTLATYNGQHLVLEAVAGSTALAPTIDTGHNPPIDHNLTTIQSLLEQATSNPVLGPLTENLLMIEDSMGTKTRHDPHPIAGMFRPHNRLLENPMT
jgi:hypothetical protein